MAADLYIEFPHDQITFPNPYFVSLLSIALGQSDYFRDTGMNEYVHSPTWPVLIDFLRSNTSSPEVTDKDRKQLLYIYNAAFGNETSPSAAAVMVDGLPHPNIFHKILAAHITVIMLAVLFVAMKFYTRLRVLTGPKREDWLVFAALLFFVASSTISFIGVREAYSHIYDVPGSVLNTWFRMGVIVFYPLMIGMCLVKLSFLEMYRTLAPSDRFVRICYAVAIFLIIGSLAYLIALSLVCYPTNIQWKEPLNRRCSERRLNLNLALSVFYVVTDFMILALPSTIVWNMKLPLRTKIGVILMFTLGMSACIFSILRTVSSSITNVDFTWHSIPTLIYAMLEMYIGVICACLPALRNHFVPSAANAHRRYSHPTYPSKRRSKISSIYGSIRMPRRGSKVGGTKCPSSIKDVLPGDTNKTRGMSFGGVNDQNFILSGILKRELDHGELRNNESSELEEIKEDSKVGSMGSVVREKPAWRPKTTTYDDTEPDDLVIGEDLGDSYRQINRAMDAGYTFGGSSTTDLERGRR